MPRRAAPVQCRLGLQWGFVPVSQVEMTGMVKAFRPLLRPEFGVYVERGGGCVGFALILPNLFEIAGDLGGAPPPRLAEARLARHGGIDSVPVGASCSASQSRLWGRFPAPASPSSSSMNSCAGRRKPVYKTSNAVGFSMITMQ